VNVVSRRLLALAGAGVLAVSLAACGGGDSGSGGGGGTDGGGGGSAEGGAPWILGTTDTVTSLDPAGAYDLGSWTLQYNTYQRLLTIPSGGNTPEGDAAESCEYEDPQTFTCTLKDGLTFSNGNPLTSSDVKFSLERNISIADPNGASGLLASLTNADGGVDPNAIETPDDRTVTFNLNKADTTFQFVLTTNAAAIVDEDTFPADQLAGNDQAVGSGPFALAQYEDGNQAVLQKSAEYQGPNEAQSSQVFVKYYQEPSALKVAVENGEVDIAWRSLSPTDITDLQGSDSVEVIEGEGSEIRYFVWQLGTPTGRQQAVRQAVAELVDREAIAQRAYDGTVEPLYSIVPPGFPGQVDAFQQEYGTDHSVDQARQLLQQAGVQTPVNLTLGYTPSHYGPAAVDEATEVKRQLDASGLFNVQLKSAEWTQYQTLYKQNAYDLFQLGWFPDFLDADNYLSPFLVDGGFYENNYSNQQVNQLVAKEQGSSDEQVRQQTFEQLQQIVAQEVPLIPSWVGKNTAAVNPAMQGVEQTLDPSFIFRMWEVSKSEG
jgi:peptide/nickel transport system substrate-binding protein